MKIAILGPLVTPIREPQLGGSQALVADIARALAGRGHAVRLFAASGSEVPGVDVVDTGIDAAELAGALYRHGGAARPGLVRAAFARAWALLGDDDHDLVHNHAFDAPAIELSGGRVVHTLHLPPEPSVLEAARASSDSFVCVSRAQSRLWSPALRIDAVVPNGVPVDRIPWSEAGGEKLVFAGRLSPEKGALEAVEIARRAGLAIDVYGDPYDPDYARLVPARPPLRREDLWRRMARARAVLCPARWEEPFGLVAAEAQAAGTPVVAFRRGGLEEVVVHGRTGALVGDGDLDAAADAVHGIYDRVACRDHAERNLGLDAAVTGYERVYERVLERERAWGPGG